MEVQFESNLKYACQKCESEREKLRGEYCLKTMLFPKSSWTGEGVEEKKTQIFPALAE